jgi:hypothetical protein
VPWAAKTASKAGGILASRSRSRSVGRIPAASKSPVTFRACWVTQAAVGCAVHPARSTRRVQTWMKNNT